MKEEIRMAIHELDQTAERIRNPVLLETAAVVREALTGLPEEGSEGVINREWMERIKIWLSKENHSEAESIPNLLRILTEPSVRFAAETLPNTSAGIRELCRIQRNRMHFVQALEPYIGKIKDRLPETERQEEEYRMRREEQLASEGMDHMLALYRQKAAEELSGVRVKRLRLLSRYEMETDEKQRCLDTEDRIQAQQDLLHEAEEMIRKNDEIRRINPEQAGLHKCSREERGENSVREQPGETDEE